MNEQLKKPYQISIWKDVPTNDNRFNEEMIAIIGSDTMTSPSRAFSPQLTKNVNGEVTFTFSMLHRYFDNDLGEEIFNPLIPYMVNERKVKLKYGDEWYDFIIKNCEESSEADTFQYSCTDLWVNELAKTGYNVELAQELGNNQGTVTELAERVLESTDWEVDKKASESIRQWVQEPLYKAQLIQNIKTDEMLEKEEVTLAKGEVIYFFYSDIIQKRTENIQVLRDLDREEGKWVFDDNNVVKGSNYMLRNSLTYTGDKPDIVSNNIDIYFHTTDTEINPNKTYYIKQNNDYVEVENPVSADLPTYFELDRQPGFIINLEFQGYRLNYAPVSKWDPLTEKYVDLYQVTYEETITKYIYHYKDYEYLTSDILFNSFTNGTDFDIFKSSISGWSPYGNRGSIKASIADSNNIQFSTYPKDIFGPEEEGYDKFPKNLQELGDTDACLLMTFKGTGIDNAIFNSGIRDNASLIGGFSKGEEYIFRAKYNPNPDQTDQSQPATVPVLGLVVADYEVKTIEINGDKVTYYQPDLSKKYFEFKPSGNNEPVNYEKSNNEITGGYFLDNTHKTYVKEMPWGKDTIPPSRKYVYIAEEEGQNKEYVWSNVEDQYVSKNGPDAPQKSGVNYWSIKADCLRSISAEELKAKNIGLFVINCANTAKSYWVRDIEFFKYRQDSNGHTLIPGSAPEATNNEVDYYYIKDDTLKDKEKVKTYFTLDALATDLGVSVDNIIQVYNNDYDKITSIEVKESNYFNIIQELCEKFECWAKFTVAHNENGSIATTKDGKAIKKVSFHEYAGKDNFAGFKYGINLSSIQRTLDSNEFVSKMIVAQPASEYVDGGVLTIRKADANPSGESYILNFSYYLNQGLIDGSFYEEFTQFQKDLKEKNIEIDRLSKEYEDIQAAMTRIDSTLTVYSITMDVAPEFAQDAEDDLEKITGATSYENYINSTKRTDKSDEVVMDYLAEILTAEQVQGNYGGITTQLLNEYKNLQLKADGAQVYEITISLSDEQTIVSSDDFVGGLTCTLTNGTTTKIAKLNLSNKTYSYTDLTGPCQVEFQLSDILSSKYKIYDGKKDKVINGTVNLAANQAHLFYLLPNTETDNESIKAQIEEKQKEKDALEKNFFEKYGRFIQEGTWTSEDYVDNNLYYLDALQVSNTSAQPKVTYTINVVEVSELEGLENYLFDVGDKTYIEDTEFFGWTLQSGLKTPIKEEVIVSEVVWNLDQPEENQITIQNYKTQFEDLFQRIGAAVQSVEYNQGAYQRAASMLDSNGLINSNLLTASLNNISGSRFGISAIGAAYVDRDGIVVTDITRTINQMKLSPKGLMVSEDAGVTWRTIVSPDGIDIKYIKAGIIDAGTINIMDGNYPSFRWDKDGITAYSFDQSENYVYTKTTDQTVNPSKTYYEQDGEEYVPVENPKDEDIANYYERTEDDNLYDLSTYVRLDKYGLYGIDNNLDFVPSSPEDIENEASFGLTWNGFFIRNSYTKDIYEKTSDAAPDDSKTYYQLNSDNQYVPVQKPYKQSEIDSYYELVKQLGGYVSISKDNDIRVVKVLGPNDEITKIKIGALEFDEDHYPTRYGMSIRNDADLEVFKTDDDGNAVFNNVSIKGSIKAAVFEYEEINAIGGIVVVRPSSTIKDIVGSYHNGDVVGTEVIIENPDIFNSGDYCKLGYDGGYYTLIKEDGHYILEGFELGIDGYIKTEDETIVEGKEYYIYNNETQTYDLVSEPSIEYIQSYYEKALQPVVFEDIIGSAIVSLAHFDFETSTVSDNYGIAINSSNSDTMAPEKAITLFEYEGNIDEDRFQGVGLNYKGVFGTLPDMTTQPENKVNDDIYNYMRGTQGIFTDNMYLGNDEQYIAYYTNNGNKTLAIRVKDIDIIGGEEDLVKGSLITQINNVVETAGEINAAIEIKPEYVRLFKGITPEGAEKPVLQSYVNLTADRIEFFNTEVETEFAHTWVNATSLNSDDLYFSNAYPRYEAAKRPDEENGTGNLIIYARDNGHLTIKNIR